MLENANVFQQLTDLLERNPTEPLNQDRIDTSHALLAAKLLTDAANFFIALAKQNPDVEEQLSKNANVYYSVGQQLEDAFWDYYKSNGDRTSVDKPESVPIFS